MLMAHPWDGRCVLFIPFHRWQTQERWMGHLMAWYQILLIPWALGLTQHWVSRCPFCDQEDCPDVLIVTRERLCCFLKAPKCPSFPLQPSSSTVHFYLGLEIPLIPRAQLFSMCWSLQHLTCSRSQVQELYFHLLIGLLPPFCQPSPKVIFSTI